MFGVGAAIWETGTMTETHTVKVHLMRHGEVHNPERIVYGRLPGYRLSDRVSRWCV